MVSIQEDIKLQGLSLAIGETTHKGTCPKCNKSGSFSITRMPSGLLYNCFRAVCSNRGYISSKAEKTEKKTKELYKFKYPTRALDKKQYQYFMDKYGLFEDELLANRVVYCEELNCFVFPTFDLLGQEWGCVTKAIDKNVLPKSKVYNTKPHPKYSFTLCPTKPVREDMVILVEDIISSILISAYAPSVALLGVSIDDTLWDYISDKHVVIILDADAKHLANKYIRDYRLFAKKVSTVHIEKDIKDMDAEEFHKLETKLGNL